MVADLKPVHPPSALGRAGLVMVTGAVGVASVVTTFGMASLSGTRSQIIAAIVSGVMVMAAGIALGGALSPATSRLPSRRSRALLILGLVAVWTLFIFANGALSTGANECPNSLWSCLTRGLVTGTVLLGAWLWIWRRSDPWTPRVGGALMGALAGTIASAGLGVACLTTSSLHLLSGHWLIVPLLAGAGCLLARRAVAP